MVSRARSGEGRERMDNTEALARLMAAARALGNQHVERAAQEALVRVGEATAAQVIPFPAR